MSFRGERIGLLEKVWAGSASALAILFSTMMSTSMLLGGLAPRYRDGVFFLQQGSTIRPVNQGVGAFFFSTVVVQFLVFGVTAALTVAVFLRHATCYPREVFDPSIPQEDRYLMLMVRSGFSFLVPSAIFLVWAVRKVFFGGS